VTAGADVLVVSLVVEFDALYTAVVETLVLFTATRFFQIRTYKHTHAHAYIHTRTHEYIHTYATLACFLSDVEFTI